MGGPSSILGWSLIALAFVVLCVIKYIGVIASRGSTNGVDNEKGR